ncbi:TadE/TadG family type IV pilus assembly protein [Methylorubrum extorquens]
MSAIEFAFIAPVLVILFIAAIEIPRAIATNNRLAQATIAMADLASKNDYADINDVFAAAQVVAAPYSLAGTGIVLTAGGVYQVGNDFVARVCSSVQSGDNAHRRFGYRAAAGGDGLERRPLRHGRNAAVLPTAVFLLSGSQHLDLHGQGCLAGARGDRHQRTG